MIIIISIVLVVLYIAYVFFKPIGVNDLDDYEDIEIDIPVDDFSTEVEVRYKEKREKEKREKEKREKKTINQSITRQEIEKPPPLPYNKEYLREELINHIMKKG